MKVGLLFTFLNESGGIPKSEHIFLDVIKENRDRLKSYDFHLLSYSNIPDFPHQLNISRGKILKNILEMRKYLSHHKIDFVFYQYHTFPLFLVGKPYAVKIHDTNPLRSFVPAIATILNVIFARGVIVPSFSTKDNLSRLLRKIGLGVFTHKIFVAPSPIAKKLKEELVNPDKSLLEKFHIKDGGYFFTIGSDDIDFICRGIRDLSGLPIIIGGKISAKQKTLLSGLYKNLIFSGFIEDSELAALYSGSLAVVYKNANEGFGYIPLETVLSRANLITNPDNSIGEIIGDSAFYYQSFEEYKKVISLVLGGAKSKEFESYDAYDQEVVFDSYLMLIVRFFNYHFKFKEFISRILNSYQIFTPFMSLRRRAIVFIRKNILIGGNFQYQERSLSYFFHIYNSSYANERKVEIAIARNWLENFQQGVRILEVGNVLSHYLKVNHQVVDKYEEGQYEKLTNCDVVDFWPEEKFDVIISVSTLEHVGYDEKRNDSAKTLKALEHILVDLLMPGGECHITVPWGYNPTVDNIICEAELNGTLFACPTFLSLYVRKGSDWFQVSKTSELEGYTYGSKENCANAIVVLDINKQK